MASGDSFLNWRKPWLVFVGTISRVGSKRFWKRICSCACYLKKVLSGALKTPGFVVWSRFPHFAVRVELNTERHSWIVLNAEPKWIPVDYEDNIHDPDLTCNAAPCTVFCFKNERSLKTYSLCACKKIVRGWHRKLSKSTYCKRNNRWLSCDFDVMCPDIRLKV